MRRLHEIVCVALMYTSGQMSSSWVMAREKKSHYLNRNGRESVTFFGKLGSGTLNQVFCLEKSSFLLNTFVVDHAILVLPEAAVCLNHSIWEANWEAKIS
jgi:hypothetical protein